MAQRFQGLRFLSRWGSSFRGRSLEQRLDEDSPVRIWLARHRARAQAGSGTALLGVLADPQASGWIDRAVAYQALGEIELSPAERSQAQSLLSHAVTNPRTDRGALARLGISLLLAVGCSILVGAAFSAQPAPEVPLETGGCIDAAIGSSFVGPYVALMTLPAATALLFAGLTIRELRRTRSVQRIATASLAQLGDPEGIAALATPTRFRGGLRPGRRAPLSLWLTQYQQDAQAASSAALLSALTDPRASTWKERVAGYRALGKIDLTSVERTQATRILAHALTQPSAESIAKRVPGIAFLVGLLATVLTPVLPASLSPALLLNHFTGLQWFLLLFLTNSHFPQNSILGLLVVVGLFSLIFALCAIPFVFAGLTWQERRRALPLQLAAVTALHQIGDPGAPACEAE